MIERILELDRKTNTLRIYVIPYFGLKEYYAVIKDVTYIKSRGNGWVDLYSRARLRGFVTHIEEIKEKW
jgi:hypothetical protein